MTEEFDKKKIALLQNVQLDTLDGSMDFFRKCINAYVEAELPERSLRALTYALRGYLDFIKHKDELELKAEIEQRITALEQRLEEEGIR